MASNGLPQHDPNFDMSVYDDIGPHIRKRPLIISLWTIYALAIIAVLSRYYVRIRIQHQFTVDDYILLFGTVTLTASLILMQGFYIDSIYMIQYMQFGDGKDGLPLDWLARIYRYQITGYLSYTLSFCTIISIKFCFLFLFKGLISRIRWLKIYWWFVFVFTTIVSIWGLVLYWVVCPYYGTIESLRCGTGDFIFYIVRVSVSGMALDIASDFLILFIPIRLIWQVKIRPAQKLALCISLCLTSVMIVATLIRAVKVNEGNKIDATWELYMQYLAAEVGLILTSFTAFRQFFVARARETSDSGETGWRTKINSFWRRIRGGYTWMSSTPGANTTGKHEGREKNGRKELPNVPRGTMTGVRSWIDRHGRTKMDDSQATQTTQTTIVGSREGDEEKGWPTSSRTVQA